MQKILILLVLVLLAIVGGGYVLKEHGSDDLINEETGGIVPNTSIDTPFTLHVLDLSGQGLTKTPEYVFGRTDIDELNLSNNSLTGSLQAEVRHLQNLKILNLSNNKFTGVPAEVGQLSNLEILDLSNNQLTGLPYELGNLSQLKVLNLTGNNYSQADLARIKEKLPGTTVIIITH